MEAEEQEEEEEAKNIQKRLAENLNEDDYDLSFFQVLIYINLFVKLGGVVVLNDFFYVAI